MATIERKISRSSAPKPFIKWAGGKRQLLPELLSRVEAALPYGRYHEPFVGGGALYFALAKRDALGESTASLSDHNPRLIETYRALARDPEGIIRHLRNHAKQHGQDYYYKIRASSPRTPATRAARLIYLNRTCFNGLYRENSKGEFNVPIGRYKNPTICDAENLRAVSRALAGATIESRHFETVLDRAAPGDFVYFDPPYVPLSDTAHFTGYTNGKFDETEQRRLAEVYAELDRNGVKVLLSNSMAPLVKDLYDNFQIDTVHATRNVNSRSDRRGKIEEALVRNY